MIYPCVRYDDFAETLEPIHRCRTWKFSKEWYPFHSNENLEWIREFQGYLQLS